MTTSRLEVLVVEDEDAIREVLRDLLEGAGYVVQGARDGPDALAILRASERGLLVLLDNLLPGLNGAEVLAALDGDGSINGGGDADASASAGQNHTGMTRHTWVVITASPQKITPKMAAQLQRMGAPIITKPFDLTTLMAAVDQAALRLTPS
jgi:CheY-like chemotaxis protein